MTKLFRAALAAPVLMLATPVLAQADLGANAAPYMPTPTPANFVKKAGASDKFEITTANLMMNSSDPAIKSFAQQMITDHTKSTAMIKSAAGADKVVVAPPVLMPEQTKQVTMLKAATGKKRDTIYIQQQKQAHQKALNLMETYSKSGTASHLRETAGQIAPVVQSHLDMLNKMPMGM